MYCGRCGATNNGFITREIEENGSELTISYFGVCKECGELLGIKEIFKQTDWDYIDLEVIKKTLKNFNGKGKIIKK